MATLLHIDSALAPQQSSSREVGAAFVKNWLEAHPGGTVVHRDLAAHPVPHLGWEALSADFVPAGQHTEEQRAAVAVREELVAELEAADAVLLAAPMYNFSIPSTLKAWLDQVIVVGRTGGPESTVKGLPFTVIASRGGSYAPGTPRESFEFVTNYVEKLITGMLGAEVDFIVPELTLAPVKEEMAELRPLAHASREKAFEEADVKARALAARLTV
ncbi:MULTISPECIES: FMN-dependent NADH-azoreductase [unclassified Streptomyces]|uniref:FMN dependent NADH:quinone oxidoreductase n=1 Tax=Streptomyces evansiae TaxID=3075535 RepID=A0ABD5ED73_9ACTN|nr:MULTISPECIES: NAD(P)H-dependent oxidoreductase [unclassified Streptomyces]ASY33825.1 FMN-dependent NADH-azoreductase [Streptomyces sp. CLI2509]MDT0419410.1 NAD(P)H-dependent oxidoreductase [Streptomyces sp. DSM 41982]MDT0425542.1 NAD(P)H-dependent oxidoreductase [Streptomyces sp. DSM 41859]MYX23832.1 FMN-dependent NADH-azoreductase [Streptomyces sp. SID8380]WEH28658.1 NAD(P)H-dependent oxidoreductase [Streptomyces sp. AM 3-1-1]